jgi:hypothetical protein
VASRINAAPAPRVALACDDDRTAAEVDRIARVRGFPVDRIGLEAAITAPVGAIAWSPAEAPDPAAAAKLAPLTRAAAENRRPAVLLCAWPRPRGKQAEERAAALAYLRAHGAILAEDPDVWFETCALIAGFGAPAGPRAAIVAPPGSWLRLQAIALGCDLADELPPAADELPNDAALVDGEIAVAAPQKVGNAIVVPVVARAESLPADGRPALVGLRAALAAVSLAGRHAERLAIGLGPVPLDEARKLKVDKARLQKAFVAAGLGDRLGDHETKLIVSAYGGAVTRQAIATTPSAAVRIAQTCGWPVEVKAWDPALADERELPAQGAVKNPPEVRRAFAAAASTGGLPVGVPVIVRASPPAGREVAARVERLGELGWTVVLEAAGSRPACAPAPLRRPDAEDLGAALEASRAGETPPDRAALADLLVRASHAAVLNETDLDSLDLARIVVAPKGGGALLVDARARLKRRRPRP